ncbi:hypothetical protein BASA81_003229 [Batrachochytrium salamandrivorans]|nr:hypothetical protein BASA81_003229 [Batrachochytrium salamandrivorans]
MATTSCDFCSARVSRVEFAGFPVFECQSHTKAGAGPVDLGKIPPGLQNVTRLVFCQANRELVCTLANKYPGKCNLSDKRSPHKFQIFDCKDFPVQATCTYRVDLPQGWFSMSQSCLLGARFGLERGGLDFPQIRIVQHLPVTVFVDERDGEEYVLKQQSEKKNEELVVGKTYSFTGLAKCPHARNVLERTPQSTCTQFVLTRDLSVQQFLESSKVQPFTGTAKVKVFFRDLKRELLFLVNRYELCLVVCFTGPDLDFVNELGNGKCAGIVVNKPTKLEVERNVLALKLAMGPENRPVLCPKPVIFTPAPSSSSSSFECVHSKFIVFGKLQGSTFQPQAVWTGSFNFTNNSNSQCVENAVLLEDEQVALQYKQEFSRIYSFVRGLGPQPAAEEEEVGAPRVTTPPKSESMKEESKQRSQRKPIKTPGKLLPVSGSPLPSPNLLAEESPKRLSPQSGASFLTPNDNKVTKKLAAPSTTATVYFTPKQSASQASPAQKPSRFNSKGKVLDLGTPTI